MIATSAGYGKPIVPFACFAGNSNFPPTYYRRCVGATGELSQETAASRENASDDREMCSATVAVIAAMASLHIGGMMLSAGSAVEGKLAFIRRWGNDALIEQYR